MMERETNQHLEPRKKKKVLWIIVIVLLLVAAVAVGAVFLMDYINNQPTPYIDENGDTVAALSRNEMEEAYELGVSYFEQGNYENAISKLKQVTDKSSKYEDAQQVYVEAMVAYVNKWIGQAEVQLESGNYEAALAIAESGMELLGEDAMRYEQTRNILDHLKSDMLDRMEETEKQQDYTQAFFCIRIAKECLPEDVEVQTNYDWLYAMSTAQTALDEAEEYAEDEDMEQAFAVLEDALAKVENNRTAAEKITEAYEDYKKDYIEQLNEKIGIPQTISEYEQAIELLSAAVELWPDDKDLADRLEELSDARPVSVNTMNIVDMKQYRVFRGWQNIDDDDLDDCIQTKTSAVDNFGTTYNDASLIICGGHSEYYGATYLTYDCAQYNTLSGVASLWEESKSHAQNAVFFIIGCKDDGTENMLMQKSFPSGTRPQPINLDLAEYSLVKIGVKVLDEKGEVDQVWPVPVGVILSDLAMAK